ncbi:hypothetical protein [Dictyobacter kobayashii]|uniref:Uncharacterized protein n=1 Tax=Dictyobacter kobayashii TaxID=2014872 RepID=A0A402AYP2_9CHLR|nr:hypothetical protein [Dictyobacter kobayashii]GCE24229.1 hypothetical protein KDK_80290 [Dictyobacter kobayashii]
METNPRQAADLLEQIEQASRMATRYSLDNGLVLLVWGMTFLLDMVGFDVSRVLGSVLPGLVFMCVLNVAMITWRVWYSRRLPIQLRRVLTNKIIYLWSFYYVTLIGLGVGAWIFLSGSFPPFWFTLLGILGALPLLVSGWRMRRRAYTTKALKDGSIAA